MKGPWIWLDKGALTTILMKTACSCSHTVMSKDKTGRTVITTYEDLILCALDRVFRLEECEANEKRSNNIQSKFRHQVRGVSPVPNDVTFPKNLDLVYP